MSTHEMSYIRYVHRPYKRPDKYSIATPRQIFDHTRVYRIVTCKSDDHPLIDVAHTMHVERGDQVVPIQVIRLFFVGAEADMDRYLRYLNNVALKDEAGAPRPILVLEQYVSEFQQEQIMMEKLGRKIEVKILFPGELDECDILVDTDTKSKKERWSIY